jgi:sortase (surface protein transpeptidase)
VNLTLAAALMLALPTTMVLAQEDAGERSARTGPVPLDVGSRPVRVRVPYFGIDLPVVSSERKVTGNPAGYPLCDVAQYLISREPKLVMPGQPGTSWLYGHAQPGMLLPLTESYFQNGRSELMGKLMQLQLRDGRLLTYRISEVRVAHDYDVAERPNASQQRLVLQTSTGSTGASPRLMVAGRLVDSEWTDEPRPEPQPRACWQARPAATPRAQGNRSRNNTNSRNNGNGAAAEATPAPLAESTDELDSMTLLVGSGAILLGATVVAVYIVRRP